MADKVWSFETARFEVALYIEEEFGYRYDGEDDDGETQRMIDDGEYIAFAAKVSVTLDGEEIADDTLYGSVYDRRTMAEFWTAHRDRNPTNRNCAANTYRVAHYFPGMVKEAISEARKVVAKRLNDTPRLRA